MAKTAIAGSICKRPHYRELIMSWVRSCLSSDIFSSLLTLLLFWITTATKNFTSVQPYSQNVRLGLSKPGMGLSLDRNFKSRLVLVLVLKKIDNLTELRCSARPWSKNTRLGLSRSGFGLGLDKIFKSRPVLVLV